MQGSAEPYYLPTPAEIQRRAAQIRFLRACGFCDTAMRAVMVDESPGIKMVRRLVFAHGREEACKIVGGFVDGCCARQRGYDTGAIK